MFHNLLARLDSYFLPFIYKMEDIFKNEGDDYSKYSENSDLDEYIANEPYVVENVWEKIVVEPINVVISNGFQGG